MYNFFIILNKYYKQLIFIFILLIIGIFSNIYYISFKNNQIKKSGDLYINYILNNENKGEEGSEKALDELKLIEKDDNNFGLLAKLTIAQALLTKGEFSLARDKLKEIFENKKFDKSLKDYAFFIYAQNLISQEKYTEFDEIKEELSKDDFIFKTNAQELLLISYLVQEKNDKAKDLIYEIKKNSNQNMNPFLERIKQFEISMHYNDKSSTITKK